MKKVLIALLMAAVAVPLFNGCKKGAEDPGISLKSRNARLIADWKLKSIQATRQYYVGTTLTTRVTAYDGTTWTETINPGAITTSGTGTFTLSIQKDGIFTYSESFTPSGGTASVVSGEDYWYWNGNDNSKIAVEFGYMPTYLFFSANFNIVELSSKELKLRYYWKETVDGEVEYYDGTFTFEAQ